MAGNMKMAIFTALAVAALVINSASAVTYDVGDSLGWTIPPGGAVAYSTWASNHTFKVGDVLVFKFTSGQHDVAKVTKEAFDACNATGPISMTTTSPASLTLDSAGEHYYICTFGGHCGAGQKLAVNVTGTSSPAPAPAPAATTPPPQAASPTPVLAPEPSSTTPPAPSAPAPSPGGATSPSPSTSATPPGTTATPPSTTATPPGTTATPPSGTTTPGATPPTGETPSSATSMTGVAGLSAAAFSFAVAFFMF